MVAHHLWTQPKWSCICEYTRHMDVRLHFGISEWHRQCMRRKLIVIVSDITCSLCSLWIRTVNSIVLRVLRCFRHLPGNLFVGWLRKNKNIRSICGMILTKIISSPQIRQKMPWSMRKEGISFPCHTPVKEHVQWSLAKMESCYWWCRYVVVIGWGSDT